MSEIVILILNHSEQHVLPQVIIAHVAAQDRIGMGLEDAAEAVKSA